MFELIWSHKLDKRKESGLNDHNYQWTFQSFNVKHSFFCLTSYSLKLPGFSLFFFIDFYLEFIICFHWLNLSFCILTIKSVILGLRLPGI